MRELHDFTRLRGIFRPSIQLRHRLCRSGMFVALLLLLPASAIQAQVRILPAKPIYAKLDSALSVVVEQTDVGISQQRAVEALQNRLVQQPEVPASIRVPSTRRLSQRGSITPVAV